MDRFTQAWFTNSRVGFLFIETTIVSLLVTDLGALSIWWREINGTYFYFRVGHQAIGLPELYQFSHCSGSCTESILINLRIRRSLLLVFGLLHFEIIPESGKKKG